MIYLHLLLLTCIGFVQVMRYCLAFQTSAKGKSAPRFRPIQCTSSPHELLRVHVSVGDEPNLTLHHYVVDSPSLHARRVTPRPPR